MTKKYIALKGNASDDSFFSKLKTTEEAALSVVKSPYSDFDAGDKVVLYEVTLKAIKKGKVEVSINES